MRFKLSTKPSRRAATRVLVVQVAAVATQGSSYTLSSSMHCAPLPVLSLPPSLVCKHVFEAGHKPLAEKPSTWLSPVFPVSMLTSRMLGEDECLPPFLSLCLCFPRKRSPLHFVKCSGLLLEVWCVGSAGIVFLGSLGAQGLQLE